MFLCLADGNRSEVLRRILEERMPEITFAERESGVDPHAVRFMLTWEQPVHLADLYPNLEVLFCIGAGVDHFAFDSLPSRLRVVRMVEPGLTEQMQHYAVMGVLTLARDLPAYQAQQRECIWRQLPSRTPASLCVSVMGLGHIGRAVLEALRQFGYRLRGWSRTPHVIEGVDCYSGPEELPRFLAETNILICLLPLTDETRGLLSVETLSTLPRGASVINMARGAHLVQEAVVTLLDSNHLDRVILDVTDPEPLPPQNPLWKHERVIITPHIAGNTIMESAAGYIIANLDRYRKGLLLDGEVDRHKGY
ncbi:MAG: glyoxylate/hydroxypyruvate reductase A [Rhizobiaceae bacterium]|nr:glyoxylate/hydroxypyruvate reductase A [Rhizobiaceae bacterium]